MKYLSSLTFVAVLFLTVLVSPSFAAQTATLLPVSDGTYLQWTPKSGATHYTMVDEATCNGTTDYNSTTTVGNRDSYGISLSSIPDGSTITKIDITPCASKNTSGGTNSTMNLFYRLNAVNSADAGNYSVTGTTPGALATTSFTGLSTLKLSTTTLEAGAVYTAGNRGLRLSRMAAVITYTPLATPSGLTAAATGSAVTLTWVDNASNEDGFRIERSDNGGAFIEIGTVGPNIPTYNDPGLTEGTYTYRVRAYNVGATTGYTANSTAYVLNAPASLSVVTASPSVTLTWVDNSSNEDSFKIERRASGIGSFTLVKTVAANTTSTNQISVPFGVWEYRVRAARSTSASDYSNTDTTTVLHAPSNLLASPTASSSIILTWTDNSSTPAEDGFIIERKEGVAGIYAEITTVGTNVTTYEDQGLTPGVTYFYRIRGYAADDTSAYSATASATAL